MTVSFPGSAHSFPTLVDLVDSVLASHQNDRAGEISAIETALLSWSFSAQYARSTLMSAAVALLDTDAVLQKFTCGGANRILTLPAAGVGNHAFVIMNESTPGTFTIDIQTSAGISILAVPLVGGAALMVAPDGTSWVPVFLPVNSLIAVKVITSGTVTYTPSPGTRIAWVRCVGGGGSGGGSGSTAASASCAGGGGGGAYSEKVVAITKASYTVAVGAGGTAPIAGNNPGNAGNDTTFDSPSICTAKGGGAGPAGGAGSTSMGFSTAAPGGAASSGVGDLKADGSDGGISIRLSGLIGMSGNGGASSMGGAAAGKASQGNGGTGSSYGGGGAGANTLNGGTVQTGGAGGNGILIVMEFA